jgi:hypothetical protein
VRFWYPIPASERARRLWTFAAIVVALLVLAEAIFIALVVVPWNWEIGQDYRFYRDIGTRFLADGSYYLPRQLGGAYEIRLMEEVLYPPWALFLFVPFAVLPVMLWWLVPTAVSAFVLRWLKPEPWAWCAMLVLLAWPRAIGAFLFGNTDIWALAGVFGGIRWGWPAVLLLLKPTLFPFSLVGVKRRSWWLLLAILVGLMIPMIGLWADYAQTVRNTIINSDYSLGSLPLLIIPVVAWLGSRERARGRPSVPLPRRTTPRRLPTQ